MHDEAATSIDTDMPQLLLPLPVPPPRYERDDFVIAPSNETAWRAGHAWLASDEQALIIHGPPGAGKTHLAHILAGRTGVFADWRGGDFGVGRDAIVVLDNLPADQPKLLMSAFEDAMSVAARVILVGEGAPASWAQTLKDLRTRLLATPYAALNEPDEALLRTVMAKSFDERQLGVEAKIIEYVAPRIPLSFAAAHQFVAIADYLCASQKRSINVALARDILTHYMDKQ